MMPHDHALELLRRHDPAAALPPADAEGREGLRRRIAASRTTVSRPHRRRSPALVALAVGAVAVLGAGAAWASGSLPPLGLFRANPQGRGTQPGDLWHQRVLPRSVRRAATVHLADVGPVQFWYARTATHGWCGALRLPSGQWVATGRDPLDAGGAVPGCYPTREQVNGDGKVYVLNGFDYQEGDVDATGRGGAFWRIEYGLTTIHGAVRVRDIVSGRSAPVARGGAFALALPFPDGNESPMHLVAQNADGKIIGRT